MLIHFNFWVVLQFVILLFLLILILYRIIRSEKEIHKLMAMQNQKINSLQSERISSSFRNDITEIMLTDYQLSHMDQECQKLAVTLPERFTKIRLISKGGMGYVFEGIDRLLKRKVAIKMISPKYTQDKFFIKKFINEARAVASLNHTGIIKIHDVGGEIYPYFIMEFLTGVSFQEMIDHNNKVNLETLRNYSLQMVDAFNYCHENQIIHGDIKPSNIILVNNLKEIKIIDFGIAKMMMHFASNKTDQNIAFGSPNYMSPEQLRFNKVGVFSDIYSFGVTLYIIVTGKFPYKINDYKDRINNDPKPIFDYIPNFDKKFAQIIMKCIEKDEQNRYNTFLELKDDLNLIF